MSNLARLLLDACAERPRAPIGTVERHRELAHVVDTAGRVAAVLADAGIALGDRVALVGGTSLDYLVTWAALQLCGVEVAMLNPGYPAPLLEGMCTDIRPRALIWCGPTPPVDPPAATRRIDASLAAAGELTVAGEVLVADRRPQRLPGVDRGPLDIAGYMHTSGSTGRPKLCAQSHEYFLRLGRLVSARLELTATDVVLAPLPMFHINPLGYGLIGSLTGRAGVLGVERFSARGFWAAVREHGVSVLIMHAPLVEILKRATGPGDAVGHRVRDMFFTDADFLERFDIPRGLSAYGSTEAGGITHLRRWRRGERTAHHEGVSRVGGRCRADASFRLSADGEILVRGEEPGVLFSGYLAAGLLERPFDADGWFATGDAGRVDEAGDLVFIERRSESVRVKGEYVPTAYVEDVFAAVPGITDVALWRRSGDLGDHEPVLYVVADVLPIDRLRETAATLPTFMRPVNVVQVSAIPRNTSVGKVQRAHLGTTPVLTEVAL